MRRKTTRTLASIVALSFSTIIACETEDDFDDEDLLTAESDQQEHPRHATDRPGAAADGDAEVVYEVHVKKVDGEVVEFDETGVFDEDKWRRVNNPDNYVAEGVILDDEAWAVGSDDTGAVEQGYRVLRREQEGVVADPSPRPTGIDPDLQKILEQAGPTEKVPVAVKLSVASPQALPALPTPGTTSAQEYSNAMAKRRAEMKKHSDTFDAQTVGLEAAVRALGGEVKGKAAFTGWAYVVGPAGKIAGLIERPDVERLSAIHPSQDDAARYRHGELHAEEFIDSDRFEDAGFYGQNSSGTPYRVGIIENDGPQDEACFFDDSGNGSGDDCDADERFKLKMRCDSDECYEVSNFTNEYYHGTAVASVLGGDYTQNQGSDQGVGSGLPSGWRDDATGVVKEADYYYYELVDTGWGHVYAIECAEGSAHEGCVWVPVVNASYSTATNCSPASSLVREDEYEVYADSGGLPVVTVGNTGGTCSSTSCTARDPNDIPKVFTVGGVQDSTADYDTWTRLCDCGSYISSRGGADIKVRNDTVNDRMTVVDLAAPGEVTYWTDAAQPYGSIRTNTWCGTSVAAPLVAGSAVAVVDWMTTDGYSWISNAGRLHAVMLAMGDRGKLHANTGACISGDQLLCGGDHLLGFGRLKLRLLRNGEGVSPWGFHMRTTTITSSSSNPYDYSPFSAGIPTGAEMVKCVMQQREDMSTKDNISHLGLRLQIRDKVGGTCDPDEGTIRYTREDDIEGEDKHMVAFVDGVQNIEGKCLEVNIDRETLSTANAITVNTFCYYAGILDNEPN